MGTHNICLNKEVDKKYTDCNLKITELLDCALIGACAVIRLTMVVLFARNLALYSEAVPNYNICRVRTGILYFNCEPSQ